MYDRFHWTNPSAHRNRLTAEYEPIQPFLLMALAERAVCRTFVDVGANVGAYSLFATLMPSIEQVIAFEADPDTLTELRKNIRLNNLENVVRVEGKAVSDSAGTVSFAVIGRHSGANSIVSTSIHNRSSFKRQVSVEAVALDQCLPPDLSAPLCLKIDVEGHEPAVIKGATATLERREAIIQIECYGDSGQENARALEKLGYRLLTAIGPDHYLSNIKALTDVDVVIAAYKEAVERFIAYGHRMASPTLSLGSIRLEIGGTAGDLLRKIKRRLRPR